MQPAAATASIEELEAHAQAALEWQALLDRLAEGARSEPGKRRVRALAPASTVADARRRTARVRAVLSLGEHGVELPVADFPEIAETLARVSIGAGASSAELLDVLRVLERAAALRDLVREHAERAPELGVLDSDPRLSRLVERLTLCIERDGPVADGASSELADARRRAREVRDELKRRLVV
jgi:dsDNA-specific endonuclease/ATPase MutS2